MPRITELVAWGFAVANVEIPDIEPNGETQPDGQGGIKTKPGKHLVFIDQQTGEQIRVMLSDEARQELARQLNGGVIVPQTKLAALH